MKKTSDKMSFMRQAPILLWLVFTTLALSETPVVSTDLWLKVAGLQSNDHAVAAAAQRLDYFLKVRSCEGGGIRANVSPHPVTFTNTDVRFEEAMLGTDGQKLRRIAAVWDNEISRSRSPGKRFRVIAEVSKASRDEIEMGMYWDVLEIEPCWLPALLFAIRPNKGSWLSLAREGARALELLESGSPLASTLIAGFPLNKNVSGSSDVKQRATLAVDQYHKWLKREGLANPDEIIRDQLTAVLWSHANQPDKAIAMYRDMLETKGAYPLSVNDRYRKKFGTKADGFIAKTTDTTLASSYYRLARLYEAQGRQSDADATINAGLQRNSGKSALLLTAAAEYADKKGNADEARRFLSQSLTISPEFPPAHILLAEIELRRGNHGAALKACADTVTYCYGWNSEIMDRVNVVIDALTKRNR